MQVGAPVEGLFFIVGGLYLAFEGATAAYLINEIGWSASNEEKEKAKATPLMRAVVVAAGLGSIAYGAHRIWIG
jgi:hypothetical protein